MIKAKDAYHNMIMHQKRAPIMHLSSISEMVKVASMLGFEKIQIFIRTKDEQKIKNKLKQAGFILNSFYAKSLPDEVMLEINWNTAEFIGDTMKELDDE